MALKQLIVEILSGALCVLAGWHYMSGQTSRACFALMGMGILLILSELKKIRIGSITNTYTDCSFFTHPLNMAPPADPAGAPEKCDDGAERR